MVLPDELKALINADAQKLKSGGSKQAISKVEPLFEFPDLNEGDNRAKIWAGLFALIANADNTEIHADLLTLARIFSREKKDLDRLVTNDWVDLLIEKACLKEPQKLNDDQTRNIAIEAVKCMCNLIFNCSAIAKICCENGLPKAIVDRIEVYKNLDDLQIKFFDLKILFLISALCKPIRNTLKENLNGLTVLLQTLQEFLQHISKNITDPKTDFEKVSLTDIQCDFCCELLKVLFNITLHVDKEESYHKDLVTLLQYYLLLPVSNKAKKIEIHGHIVNLLTNIPGTCYKYLLTPATEGQVKVNKFVYNKMSMLALQELVYLLENKFENEMNVTCQREVLLPLLSVLLKCAISDRNMRKYLKIQILPPLKNVHTRPEEGSTLRNHLCRLLTTPITEVRDFVAELLFVLCKENVGRMIKYTGYGNAAGLFANRGLLAGRNKDYVSNYSSDSDSDTEEYKEYKHGINPVMGCYEPPHPSPFENMTEEQKEYEAMKLVELMDTMMKHGIVKPCKVGQDGRPQAIEHVLQLQEGMKNVNMKNSDSDSD